MKKIKNDTLWVPISEGNTRNEIGRSKKTRLTIKLKKSPNFDVILLLEDQKSKAKKSGREHVPSSVEGSIGPSGIADFDKEDLILKSKMNIVEDLIKGAELEEDDFFKFKYDSDYDDCSNEDDEEGKKVKSID
jgi:hypothetical protein